MRGVEKKRRGIGDVPIDRLQRLPTDTGWQFQVAQFLQLMVQQGGGMGVKHVTVNLEGSDANFLRHISFTDPGGPVFGNLVQIFE